MTEPPAPPQSASALTADDRRSLESALAALKAGRASEAEAGLRRLAARRPNLVEPRVHLAAALQSQGQFDGALDEYRAALRLDPSHGPTLLRAGTLLFERGRNQEAAALLRRAAAALPESYQAFNNLGSALVRLLRLEDGETALRRAIALKPDSPATLQNLGSLLVRQGRMEEAEAALRKALALDPHSPIAHSTLLYTLLHLPISAEKLFDEHRRWGETHAPASALATAPHRNDRSIDRQLKIGYVSADLREHAVAHFIEPVWQAHDRAQIEIIAYAQVPRPDAMTQRLQALAGQWRAIAGASDSELADMIRRDQVDILVDLSGHTAGNRLLAFARRPAPVQVTWIGYPATLGLAAIDYAIVDRVLSPPEDERFNVEKLVRLPERAACQSAHDRATSPSPLPASSRGFVTFGSFNRPTKIGPEVVAAWSRILLEVPRSRLLLKSTYLAEESTVARLRRKFEACGIARDRLDFEGASPHADYLARIADLDLALDPFPYNGGTTTGDCLARGVPIVTLMGDRRCGRSGASRLHALGLDELVARSIDDYVQLAVALARDLERLAGMRRTIVDRFAESPLGDPVRLTRHLEAGYRAMWRRWCLGLPPDHIDVPPQPRGP